MRNWYEKKPETEEPPVVDEKPTRPEGDFVRKALEAQRQEQREWGFSLETKEAGHGKAN